MNPKLSHALVAVVAFALGASAMHFVTLQAIAADERQVLERARALSEQRPIDLDAIDGFLTTLNARRAITSAKVHEETLRLVLRPVEVEAREAIDSHRDVYDAERFAEIEDLLRRQFGGSAHAEAVLISVQADLARGIASCGAGVDPADAEATLRGLADCRYLEPARREQARAELARRTEAAKP
jgi:hypothetical protein